MQAMDAANKNGTELLSELSIQFNRERQARITQEIT
jgi:F-type H+-transporting ATPase subunit gamma